MTLEEYVKKLQDLICEGKGDYIVVDSEYGSDINDPFVLDESKKVFI
jgi:hypothetical protein